MKHQFFPVFPLEIVNDDDRNMSAPDGSTTVAPGDTYRHAGMSLRQYAAISLRVPDSGTPWLDDMIRDSLRQSMRDTAVAHHAGGSDRISIDYAVGQAAYAVACLYPETKRSDDDA